jgi:hypothetical protein
MISKRYLHDNIHSISIPNRQEVEATQAKLTNLWMKKMWYCIQPSKGRMKLEDITLGEIRQSQKDKFCILTLT